MVEKIVVQEALKRTWEMENNPGWNQAKLANGQSSLISQLIYDIFGGEILKTHKKKGWHFYNRIEGEPIDFTGSEIGKFNEINHLEDLPSSPDETHKYFEQEDYSTFLMRFIMAFEKTVGMNKNQPGITA
jgi:hypothetical protein